MRRKTAWPIVWAVVALIASALGVATAQETTTGSITGEVVDAQGAPIPGATVTLTSDQGTKTFVTDGSGRFFAPFLTPGRYTVRVELSGFSPVEQKNIDVRLGQRARADRADPQGRRARGSGRGHRLRARDRHQLDHRRRACWTPRRSRAARSAATSPTRCTWLPA